MIFDGMEGSGKGRGNTEEGVDTLEGPQLDFEAVFCFEG